MIEEQTRARSRPWMSEEQTEEERGADQPVGDDEQRAEQPIAVPSTRSRPPVPAPPQEQTRQYPPPPQLKHTEGEGEADSVARLAHKRERLRSQGGAHKSSQEGETEVTRGSDKLGRKDKTTSGGED